MIEFVERKRHSGIKILLSAYIDGEVTPSEAVRVEGHLAGCQDCASEIGSLRATSSLLRSLPDLEVPRSFALTEAPAPVGFAPQLVWTTRFATSLAALFLVALLLGDVLGFVGQTPRRGSREQAFSAVQRPAAPASAAPAMAPESEFSSLPGDTAKPAAAPEPAPAEPAPIAASAPALAPAAPAPAAPAAEPLARASKARALPAPTAPAPAAAPAPVLAAAAETTGESEDSLALQSFAAPAAPFVEEPSPEVEVAGARQKPAQAVTTQTAIDEQVEETESPASPPPFLERGAERGTAAPPTADDSVAAREAGPVEVSSGLAIPLRELEIALGALVALLLAVTYRVARRGAG